MIDRSIFFAEVRGNPFPKRLDQKQVDGMEIILDTFERDYAWQDLRWLAYCLATTYHETAQTMQPVKEYGSESYLMGKKYWPYIGRGFVQLTWEENYSIMSRKLGIDLMGSHMDRALEPDIAAKIMFVGMRDGDFTGKRLADYFSGSKDDPVNARRIINGTDKAQEIAGYYQGFWLALTLASANLPELDPSAPIVQVDEKIWIRRQEVADRLRALALEIEG